MSFTSNYSNENALNLKMAVPKKRTSISKKRIRKTFWKRKGFGAALKAWSLAKSLSTGNSKSFFVPTNK